MPPKRDFLTYYLLALGPSWPLLLTFLLGVLVIAVLGNLAYSFLMDPASVLNFAGLRSLLAVMLGTGLAYFLYWLDGRQPRKIGSQVIEGDPPPAHKGIIWLFGPGNYDALLVAVKYHAGLGGGQHCWLVMQDGNEAVKSNYSQLLERLAKDHSSTRVYPAYISTLTVKDTYQTVRSLYEREAPEMGLTSEDVIGDITGATKPVTAGMVLAALTVGGALQYIESDRDAKGNYVSDTAHPVQVDVSFNLQGAQP